MRHFDFHHHHHHHHTTTTTLAVPSTPPDCLPGRSFDSLRRVLESFLVRLRTSHTLTVQLKESVQTVIHTLKHY